MGVETTGPREIDHVPRRLTVSACAPGVFLSHKCSRGFVAKVKSPRCSSRSHQERTECPQLSTKNERGTYFGLGQAYAGVYISQYETVVQGCSKRRQGSFDTLLLWSDMAKTVSPKRFSTISSPRQARNVHTCQKRVACHDSIEHPHVEVGESSHGFRLYVGSCARSTFAKPGYRPPISNNCRTG